MKKRILSYMSKIDGILETNEENTDWAALMEEHQVQIAFFQHERLIHLLVTLTFALLFVGALTLLISGDSLFLLLLPLALLILLVPYIMHYYLLENGVQHMYDQYDEIKKHITSEKNLDYDMFVRK